LRFEDPTSKYKKPAPLRHSPDGQREEKQRVDWEVIGLKIHRVLGNNFAVAVSLPFPESYSRSTKRFVTLNSFSMSPCVPNDILAGEVFVQVFSAWVNPWQTSFPILWDSGDTSDLFCAATNLFSKGSVGQFARDNLRMLFRGRDDKCP
jgi:hypothetical protein